jgi:hypothetical protein
MDKTNGGRGKASFKVQLSDSSSLTALSNETRTMMAPATSLAAKLGGVDLLAECTGGNPPGNCLDLDRDPDPDIWVNEGCHDDIAQCTTLNTEFFELINPDEANAVLNSQGRSIETGTFTHVRVYFLNNDLGDALKCNNAPVTDKPQVPIIVTLPEPLIVNEGETVTVTLHYNLSAVDCANGTSVENAINGLTATVSKN